MECLVELQGRIYEQNKDLGWHDEPRTFNTYVCLFHSELSEAVEGLRKGLMDDHLPHYPMVAVEVADFVVRVLDWFGTQSNLDVRRADLSNYSEKNNIDHLSEMHYQVSNARFFHNIGNFDDAIYNTGRSLDIAVGIAFLMADKNGWDLFQIINEKIEYNKHRADHKRENRAKDGGKKF